MNLITLLGIIGGTVLVLGAAWPVKTVSHPIKSTKNWLYALGALILTVFAYLDYTYNGAPFFFLIYELYLVFASILMFLNVRERISFILLSIGGVAMVIWSLFLFEDYSTVIFILGIIGIALGYTAKTGTRRRNIILCVASILLALFSYLGHSWVFFWLNVFFALFCAWYSRPSLYKNGS